MCIPLIAAAPIIGGAIAAGGSAAASAVGSANASAAQKDAAGQAVDFQRGVYNQQRADQAPWLQAGGQSLGELMRQLQGGDFDRQIDPRQIANDPGYQFRMAEGQKALERSAAARGGLNSGGAMKSLSRYSQGLASDEFQNAWTRNQAENTNRYNRLANVAGLGQQSAGSLGQMGSSAASQMANLFGAMGNANSAGAMGAANSISGGLQGLSNGVSLASMMQMYGQPQQQIPTQSWTGANIPTQTSYGQSTAGYPAQGFGPWK